MSKFAERVLLKIEAAQAQGASREATIAVIDAAFKVLAMEINNEAEGRLGLASSYNERVRSEGFSSAARQLFNLIDDKRSFDTIKLETY